MKQLIYLHTSALQSHQQQGNSQETISLIRQIVLTSKTPMYEQRNSLTEIEKIDFSQVLETLRLNTEEIKWKPPYEEMLSILSDEKRASVLEELV